MKKIFCWLLGALIFVWGGVQYWPVTVYISGSVPEEDITIRMPLKDKNRLDYFFRDVCFLNAWAYTLMGSKPMSIHQYTKPWAAARYLITHPEIKDILLECFWPPNFHEICYFLNPEQLRIKLGWDTLNKYIKKIPSSRFALCTYCSKGKETVCLALIDKIKLVKTVERHLEDFQVVMQGQEIHLEDLLDDKKLYRFIKNLSHDGLIGTVLGFGRQNAWLFHKYHGMDPQVRPMVSMWFEEQDEQLQQLNQKIISFQPWDLNDLFYPPFACDPQSEETKQLKQTYHEEREKIVKYYEGKDVVEASLSLFNRRLDDPL